MASGALATLALPAPASALWSHHVETLPKDVELGIAGTVKLETEAGGAECRFPIRARLIAGTSRGRAWTSTRSPAGEAASCKGLGSYALCQIPALAPGASQWPFRITVANVRKLAYGGNRATVEVGITEEAVLIRSRSVSVRPRGIFCPARVVTIAPGAVPAVPEGGPYTIANVVLSGTLVAEATTRPGLSLSGPIAVTGTLQIEDPAQRDTYSIE